MPSSSNLDKRTKDVSLLLLRFMLAWIFLYHGVPKVTHWAATMDAFAAMGFPSFLGPVVGIIEVLGGICLLLGICHSSANIALAFIMVVAIFAIHIPSAAKAGKLLDAALERNFLILTGNLLLLAFGPGKISLGCKCRCDAG